MDMMSVLRDGGILGMSVVSGMVFEERREPDSLSCTTLPFPFLSSAPSFLSLPPRWHNIRIPGVPRVAATEERNSEIRDWVEQRPGLWGHVHLAWD